MCYISKTRANERSMAMRKLIITITIATAAMLTGCATSNTWVCNDGTCTPRMAMVEKSNTLVASANLR